MRLTAILPIGLCWLLSSCVKSGTEPAAITNNKNYLVTAYVRQDTTQSLTVKLYMNKEDYYNDSNIVKTYVIPGNTDSLEVALDSNTTYYYDVYSDDRKMSNWGIWPYNNKSFKTDPRNHRYLISNNPNNIHRNLLLSDDNSGSKWVAVGSFTRAGNSWDTMSADSRNKSIIFKRSQVAVFTEGAHTREFRFGVSVNLIAKNAFIIKFYDTEDLDFIDYQYQKPYMTGKGPISPAYNALSPYSNNSDLMLPVTDTMYITNDASPHTFIMVREK